MAKILVTGGFGFIGSHLIDNLISKGHKIVVFERKYEEEKIKEYNWKPEDVSFRLGDLKDRDAVFDAVYNTDITVNLAGLLGTAEMVNNPLPAVETNIIGAINVFDAIRMHKKRGMQIAVGNYWMNNPYSITKNTAERFALMYNKEHGTDIRICRGMNIYGERQKHRPIRKIFPNLTIPALLNEKITIYGSGNQVMDLIYVADFGEVLSRVILYDNIPNNIIYTSGVGGGMTINRAAEMILTMTQSSSEVERVDMRPGEEKDAIVEMTEENWSVLEKHLNYSKENLTPIEEGFKKSIEWYKQNLNKFKWD